MKTDCIQPFDERRDIAIPGDYKATVEFCADLFISSAQLAIQEHGFFAVALAGGKTPRDIYQALLKRREEVDWSKVKLFFSDERSVPPSHPDSNYQMAMEAFGQLSLNPQQIFRMVAEESIEENARRYETYLFKELNGRGLDLVLLGIGTDGHTASLFPKTHGLHAEERLVTANLIPSLGCFRMTLTFDAINGAERAVICALGKQKAKIVAHLLTSPYDPDLLPAQRVGTAHNRALFLLDRAAAANLS